MQTVGSFSIDAIGNTVSCSSDTLQFIVNGLSNPQWYKDGLAIEAANNDTLHVTSSGNYTVTGMDICNLPASLGVSIPVVINTAPIPIVLFQVCQDYAFVVNSSDYESFQWYYLLEDMEPHAIVDNGANDTLIVMNSSIDSILINYLKVVATTADGCMATSDILSPFCDGIEDKYVDQIQLYPNPTQTYLYISNSSQNAIEQVQVFNTNGQVLATFPVERSVPIYFSVEQLPRGLYYCQLQLPDGVIYRNFVKQ